MAAAAVCQVSWVVMVVEVKVLTIHQLPFLLALVQPTRVVVVAAEVILQLRLRLVALVLLFFLYQHHATQD
jgi:hypothetical protein